MNKRTIIIGASIFIIVLFLGIFLFEIQNIKKLSLSKAPQKEETSSVRRGLCDQYSDSDEKNKCLALLNQDLSLCEKIQKEDLKNDCYLGIAFSLQSFSICEKIKTPEEQNLCKFLINLNPLICDFMGTSSEKVKCYKTFAQFSGDTSLCDKAGEKTEDPTEVQKNIQECLNEVNSELAQKIRQIKEERIKKEGVFVDKAVAEDNFNKCNDIQNTSLHDNCFYYFAMKHQDLALCDKITEEATKISCQSVLKKDPALCDNINESSFLKDAKDNCYFGFVFHVRDLPKNILQSTCMKIKNGEIKDNCYMEVALHKRTQSDCESITDPSKREVCKIIFAKDKNLCKSNIQDEYYRDYCLYYIAEFLQDKSICGEISIKYFQQKCFNIFR